jgi:hypothetical protein
VATRRTDDAKRSRPLSIRPNNGCLELRRNFFSFRVRNKWNKSQKQDDAEHPLLKSPTGNTEREQCIPRAVYEIIRARKNKIARKVLELYVL